MNIFNKFAWVLLLLMTMLVVGCQSSQPPPPPVITPDPINVVGPAVVHQNNLTVRLDYVRVLDGERNYRGNGSYFAVLIIRPDQPAPNNSAKLILPGTGLIPDIAAGDVVKLGDFGIQLQDVKPDEDVYVYLLAFRDNEDLLQRSVADIALDLTIELLLDAVPLGGAARFITEQAAELAGSEVLEWWYGTELMGEYAVFINSSDPDVIGKQWRDKSSNGHLEFHYSLIPSEEYLFTEEMADDAITANLIVENQSRTTVNHVFIVSEETATWDEGIEVTIRPNESKNFVVPAGSYKVRLIGSRQSSWEGIVNVNGEIKLQISLLTSN